MHIKELQHCYKANIEFVGDNECDFNELTIEVPDEFGYINRYMHDFSTAELQDLSDGLNQLKIAIDSYLSACSY